jgi:hypothetical protein
MQVSGVNFYAKGEARFYVYFPHGKVDCRHCPFLGNVEHINLHKCRLTEALVERYELDERHPLCPIIMDEERKETDE